MGIMFQVELVEGYISKEQKEYDNKGKTVDLLICLTQPLHQSGKVVILDSGFCVLQGIVELKRKACFCSYQERKVLA